MDAFSNCKTAVQSCLEKKRFSVAYLYSEEKTMEMHIHDCYEIYYSISGGKTFLINDRCYDIESGDLFVINNYESHYLSQIDAEAHERVVISIHPQFLASLSSPATDLSLCFTKRSEEYSNRIHLDKEAQKHFLYYAHKITGATGYGADLIENAALTELMIMLGGFFQKNREMSDGTGYQYSTLVMNIIEYINRHIAEKLTIATLSANFYVSESYICRVFKQETGTTVNKYIAARRIAIAKTLLVGGASVSEACDRSGFNDYVNFIKSFTKIVGTSPKRYAKYTGVK